MDSLEEGKIAGETLPELEKWGVEEEALAGEEGEMEDILKAVWEVEEEALLEDERGNELGV